MNAVPVQLMTSDELKALVTGKDAAGRCEIYSRLVQEGRISPNTARAAEGLAAIPDLAADAQYVPVAKPSAAEIDALVAKLDILTETIKQTEEQKEASKGLAEARAQLLAWALAFGETPKSAPASKRLHGDAFVLTATSGVVTRDNPEAIEELRDAMVKHKHQSLFAQLFTPNPGYDRAKQATKNLKNFELSKKLRALYDDIFARTASESPRAPVLRIDKVA